MRLYVYMVDAGYPDEHAVAVVARSYAEAKTLAQPVLDVPDDFPLSASLVKERDGTAAGLPPGIAEAGPVPWGWGGLELERWYRDHGWREEGAERCVSCGLAVFDTLPESELHPETDECRECGWPGEAT